MKFAVDLVAGFALPETCPQLGERLRQPMHLLMITAHRRGRVGSTHHPLHDGIENLIFGHCMWNQVLLEKLSRLIDEREQIAGR